MDTMTAGQGGLQGDAPTNRMEKECTMIVSTIFIKYTLRVLFVIAFVTLLVNSVKIAYQGWFGKKESVLVKFEESEELADEEDLASHSSLAELTKRYEAAWKAVEAYEIDESTPAMEENEKLQTEPYATAFRLKSAVARKEYQEAKIHEVRYFCLLGVALVMAGTFCFTRFNEIIGSSLLITGFGEMIGYAMSGSSYPEDFTNMLGYKLVFSLLAMALLLLTAQLTGTLSSGRVEAMGETDASDAPG